MNASLHFSTIVGNRPIAVVRLEGVASLDHANVIGHNMNGPVSIAKGVAVYLARTETEDNGFSLHPNPEFYREDVEVIPIGTNLATEVVWERQPGFMQAHIDELRSQLAKAEADNAKLLAEVKTIPFQLLNARLDAKEGKQTKYRMIDLH